MGSKSTHSRSRSKATPPAKVRTQTRASSKPKIRTNGAPPAAGPWIVQKGEVGVRIRMYRVGFGDFFLITFRADDNSEAHVIVDCGVFKGTSQTGDIGSIQAAVADMLEATKRQVALIIMTHRHADHIAGFARCKDDFAKLTVGGVWMPIWESEFDATAMRFQAELTRTAMALQSHFMAAAAPSEEQNTARKFMENATGLTAAELARAKPGASGSNATALNLLKKGLQGVTAPEYYKNGDEAKLPKALADIGVTAQILGPPPTTDLDLMKLMDLKKGVGQYLADTSLADEEMYSPFSDDWEIEPFAANPDDEPGGYSAECLKEWIEPRRWKDADIASARVARTAMEAALLRNQPVASLLAAKQLNSFLNNQSLVVLFGYKGKQLLFVGDAQAGNWERWLFESDQPDKLAAGDLSSRAQQILSSIHFYKVGHHGSSNATPKVVAEALVKNVHAPACMCSTERGVYGTENPEDPSKGTEVPRIPLLAQLDRIEAFVRSDQIDIEFTRPGDQSDESVEVRAQVAKGLPADGAGRRFEAGPFWIDCFL